MLVSSEPSTSIPFSAPAVDILKSLGEKSFTGRVLMRIRSPDAIAWQLHFQQGKLNFATSEVRCQSRIQYLLLRHNSGVKLLSEDSNISDYLYVCQHWQQGLVTLPQLRQLLSLISLEAIVQILAQERVETKIVSVLTELTPVLLSINTSHLPEILKSQVQDWFYQGKMIGPLWLRPRIQDPERFVQLLEKVVDRDTLQQMLQACAAKLTFYEIASSLNQDALRLAKQFYSLIPEGVVAIEADAGVDPLIPHQLAQSSIPLSQPATPLHPPLENREKTKFKIACVDDSPTILNEISSCLDGSCLDFAVFPITNSVRALMWVSRIQPDLILMDIGMPNINGYDLCKMLREQKDFQHIPIIMVTANTGTVNRNKAAAVGASDYLTKPFGRAELLAVVTKHLQL